MLSWPVLTPPESIHSILFVCLGNICRSPLAEGAFKAHVDSLPRLRDVLVDSCGTGPWHIGCQPDHRAISVAERRGIRLNHLGRQFDPRVDFFKFDLVVAMDQSNMNAVVRHGGRDGQVVLMREFDPLVRGTSQSRDVPDPYEGTERDFEKTLEILDRSCRELAQCLSDARRE
jgi:protein-tyrosine phosphatase